jgi:iron only hydrogenase large subunit-like protein
MEEAAAFLDRVNANEKLPMLTGCCPAWVKYLEVNKPHLLSNLSGTKSPQQIMGTVIKKYITSSAGLKPEKVFIVSVMPCTAKKAEPESDQTGNNGLQLLDAVITTRELFKMIRLMGIDFTNLEPEPADTAFSLASSAGRLFGVSGGHLEGLLRTIHFMSSGQELNPFKINELRGLKSKKEARMRINRQAYTVVAVNGLANAIQLLGEIEAGKTDYKIVEVMACPFGCINGGGQKIGSDEKSLKARMKALYDVDEEEMLKVAHKNPVITDFYDKFLSKPNSERNRDLLHHNRTKTPDA